VIGRWSPPATGLVAGGYDFILFFVPGKKSPTVIRSGRIAIVGHPDAGKSALFNPR
jgi:hypothetical protein